MSSSTRGWTVAATLAAMLTCSQLTPTLALAQPQGPEQPGTATEAAPPTPAGELRNVTYRARVDGVARGAVINYKAENDQQMSADPTMLPGRMFEANTVLPVDQNASMSVSIDWPYSANLHCEILVDGATVAQADDFIGPKLVRAQDDPGYGTLSCEGPVSGVAAPPPADAVPPGEPAPAESAPAQA